MNKKNLFIEILIQLLCNSVIITERGSLTPMERDISLRGYIVS